MSKPLLALRETSVTPLLLLSLMVPEMVPVLGHVSANSSNVSTSSISLSAVSVADRLVSTKPLLVNVRV